MLLMAHLFAGVMIGLVLLFLTGQRWTLLAASLGAIFPDLIDKPLGHLLLNSELDNGRIFCHTLLFLGFCFLIAYLLYRKNGSWVGIAFALGVLSHQYLDLMFFTPVSWLWPLLGPFEHGNYPDYFVNGMMAELSTPYEYLFFFLSVICTAYAYELRFAGIPELVMVRQRRALVLLLTSVGVVMIAFGIGGTLAMPTLENADYIMAGGLCLAGAIVFRDLLPSPLPHKGRTGPRAR
jgi:membrane-bound metal-dependent hydrolase YbcI (DUF457 family)